MLINRMEVAPPTKRAAGRNPSCEPPPDEWINPEALP
jgi:hypothetical protein